MKTNLIDFSNRYPFINFNCLSENLKCATVCFSTFFHYYLKWISVGMQFIIPGIENKNFHRAPNVATKTLLSIDLAQNGLHAPPQLQELYNVKCRWIFDGRKICTLLLLHFSAKSVESLLIAVTIFKQKLDSNFFTPSNFAN